MSPQKNWDTAGLKEALSRGGAKEHGDANAMAADDATKSRKVLNPSHAPLTYKGQTYKSKLEIRFAQHLEVLVFANEIDGWHYEPVNFRLPGKKNFYKADFSAWRNKEVYFYEVKGYSPSNERSLVKLKTAAGVNPWATFIQWKWIAGAWIQREITR